MPVSPRVDVADTICKKNYAKKQPKRQRTCLQLGELAEQLDLGTLVNHTLMTPTKSSHKHKVSNVAWQWGT